MNNSNNVLPYTIGAVTAAGGAYLAGRHAVLFNTVVAGGLKASTSGAYSNFLFKYLKSKQNYTNYNSAETLLKCKNIYLAAAALCSLAMLGFGCAAIRGLLGDKASKSVTEQ